MPRPEQPISESLIYDKTFKTLIEKIPLLLVAFVNWTFGCSYSLVDPVRQLNREYDSLLGRLIADAVFAVRGTLFHVDCQSTADNAMAARMAKYDISIAFAEYERSTTDDVVQLPVSCVLYLRKPNEMPDMLEFCIMKPDGSRFTYDVPVMKVQHVPLGEMFDRGLLLLVPFHVLRHEHGLESARNREKTAKLLLADLSELRARLAAFSKARGDPSLYNDILEATLRIAEHVTRGDAELQRTVRSVLTEEEYFRQLGIELDEDGLIALPGDKLRRERKEGRAEGRVEGFDAMASALRDAGADEELIARALESARSAMLASA